MSAPTVRSSNPALQGFRPAALLLQEFVNVRTMAGNETLTNADTNIQCLDPAGARDLTLPALEDGLWFFVVNKADAAETITIKNAAAATVLSLAQNTSGLVWCDGTAWSVVVKFTSALS